MTSVSQMSMYSTSTLVGGGGNEELYELASEHPWTEQDVQDDNDDDDDAATIRQAAALQFQHLVGSTGTADRDDIYSRQSSVTTLYAQPRSGPPNRSAPRPLAPLASLSSSLPPRIVIGPVENPHEDSLRIPWWSAMMPTPVMNRSRSNSKIRVSSTPITASGCSSDRSPQLSSSSSSPAIHNITYRRGSSSSTLQDIPSIASPIPPPLPSDYPLYAKCYCEENAYLLAAYLSRTCQQWNKHEKSATKESYMRWDVDVVVVSNKNQTVALWQQQAGLSASDDYQVVWDYHVFVVVSCQKRTRPAQSGDNNTRQSRQFFTRGTASDSAARNDGASHSWVYDLDSRLVSPTPLTEYLSATFGIDNGAIGILNKRLQPLFRVISANDYFVRFGSDRSHMKVPTSPSSSGDTTEWLQPRPEWDLILGCKALHSNSYFLDSFVDMRVRIGDGRFGVVVKLEELYTGQGLMSSKDEYQEGNLAAGVAVLLDRIGSNDDSYSQDYQDARVSQSQDSTMIPLHEDEMERTPGVMIGGVVRMGLRPPPPPPDGAIIAPGRGKRIMDPLYPAYILRAYEHRMADNEAQISTS